MKLDEIIKAKIAEMGEFWEGTADRSKVPVLLTPAAEEGADVWELWLKGARHPDWQIVHRQLSRAEAEAVQRMCRNTPHYPADKVPFDFFVRDGRKSGWNRSQVTPLLPRRQLDPTAQFDFKGYLEAAVGEVKEVWGVKVNGIPVETE